MFVNTLTADDQYSLLNRDNLMQPIWTKLFQKQKAFSGFFLAFLKSTLNFEHLQKKHGFKHCCDLNHSTVIIFSDHVEGN